MQSPTFFEYLASLTMPERMRLGAEIGYSPKYINLIVTRKQGLSEFFVMYVLESNFNKKKSIAGTQLTKKMADECRQELYDLKIKRSKAVRVARKNS